MFGSDYQRKNSTSQDSFYQRNQELLPENVPSCWKKALTKHTDSAIYSCQFLDLSSFTTARQSIWGNLSREKGPFSSLQAKDLR